MSLRFPQYIRWDITLEATNPFSPLGGVTEKRIKKSITLLNEQNMRFIFEPISETFFDYFIPVYNNHIGEKKNGTVYPVKERIQEAISRGGDYTALSLYKDQRFLGSMIFQKLPTKLSVAYRAFPHDVGIKLPCAVSLVGEYALNEHALALGITHICHGKDRNLFGYHSNIGLAAYKTKIGGVPHISNTKDNLILNTLPAYNADMFVFIGDKPNTPLTQALLISTTKKENLPQQYDILFSQYEVTVLTPDEAQHIC